jgi:nucleoside-diphosphate-sugar epimerase
VEALVTGVAGFLGSHLAEALVAAGQRVRGVDCFTPYYDPAVKRANLGGLVTSPRFELVAADLRSAELASLLDGVDVVFHLAGQPGVRPSWSSAFARYAELNVLVTQRLLDAVKETPLRRFVYASSSSVYGSAPPHPTDEDVLPRPHSPYGVTKLAAEHLCGLYAANHDVPAVSLRYFSVYGPRQRPDMAFHRFCEAALEDKPLPLYGDGEQVRDFTYVSDAVAATSAAATADLAPGTVLNIAGGSAASVNHVLDLLAGLVGRELRLDCLPEQAGEVQRTGAATSRAVRALGWAPRVDLRQGLRAQLAWHRAHGGRSPGQGSGLAERACDDREGTQTDG